jgi:4-hydroxybenzoate polyprenyltransferase
LFSLFSYLVALAFVPYQDIGDYEYDRRSGKKTLTVRLGPDKIGILSIMIGLAAILVLYGALLTLN